ncbi:MULTISPECIES: hypothetical protein [Bradyrhizobium]|nr:MULTISPECIES: hypothetical protein [unclassified Bradyrhizobium]
MEQESKPDQAASGIERPTPREQFSEERPHRSLPFASEGLEPLRDSHC